MGSNARVFRHCTNGCDYRRAGTIGTANPCPLALSGELTAGRRLAAHRIGRPAEVGSASKPGLQRSEQRAVVEPMGLELAELAESVLQVGAPPRGEIVHQAVSRSQRLEEITAAQSIAVLKNQLPAQSSGRRSHMP